MSLAPQIDNYLAGRGSPMAGRGQSFVRAGRKYGVDPRLLVGIATIESGAGQHQRLQNNPFNWGVHRGQTYESYDDAINDVARGLRRNYLDSGLTTPQQIVSKYAPGSDGNDEGNWASVVSGVMAKLGGEASGGGFPMRPSAIPRPPRATGPTLPSAPTRPVLNRAALGQAMLGQFVSGGGRIDINSLPGLTQQFYETPAPPPAPALDPAAPGPIPPTKVPPLPKGKGGFLQLPTRWKSTHPTDGLSDQGYTHAVDIMGDPGTNVGAPVSGTIIRHGSAQGGQSMYFKGDDGRTYWIGHIENVLPAGTKVKKGQVIARISADHAAPHVHLDWA